MVKNMSIPTKISFQDIYSGQDVYYFGINFPPGLLLRTGRLLGTLEYTVYIDMRGKRHTMT